MRRYTLDGFKNCAKCLRMQMLQVDGGTKIQRRNAQVWNSHMQLGKNRGGKMMAFEFLIKCEGKLTP